MTAYVPSADGTRIAFDRRVGLIDPEVPHSPALIAPDIA